MRKPREVEVIPRLSPNSWQLYFPGWDWKQPKCPLACEWIKKLWNPAEQQEGMNVQQHGGISSLMLSKTNQ